MLKRFLNKIWYFFTLVFAVIFALSFIMPYVPLKLLPFLAVVSLGIPLLFIANTFFCLYWIWRAKKHFLIPLSVLIIGLIVFDSFYQFEPKSEIVPSHSIDLMSYNTHLFNKYNWVEEEDIPREIIAFVNEEDPDIICFQEFDMSFKDAFKNYPFKVFSDRGKRKSIQAIFSKYPIVSHKVIDFESSRNAALFADVQVANYTFRVFNIHLQSLGVPSDPEAISNQQPELLINRMSSMFSMQENQAELIRTELEQSPHYNIVAGDFNNTQFSRVYRLIKGDMNDGFIQRGSGFGRSFDFKLFPMRIDFILSDRRLDIVDFNSYDVPYSDHFPLMTTFSL